MESSRLFAYMFRLKLINRWPLMRNVRQENVAEHSLQVALVAHMLAVIENHHFAGQIDPAEVALLAIYHDVSEVMTGDMPTPVKYHNPQLTDEYNKIEKMAQEKLISELPEELKSEFQPLFLSESHPEQEYRLVKQADVLCAYLKCLEEQAAGNSDFDSAKNNIEKRLHHYQSPALDYFMAHFVPSFTSPPHELSEKS